MLAHHRLARPRGALLLSGPRLNITGLGVSYILMLTAFYIDSGKRLPHWIPQIAFWLLPAELGLALLGILC
jgi:hypothetical protein